LCIVQRTSSSLFQDEPRSLVNIYSLIHKQRVQHIRTNAHDVCEKDAAMVHFKCRCDRDEMSTEIFCFICISFFLSHSLAALMLEKCRVKYLAACALVMKCFSLNASHHFTPPTTFSLQARHHTLILSNARHMHHLWRRKQTFYCPPVVLSLKII
jgi:hypothetical protein